MSQKKKVPRLTKSFIEFAKWRFTAMQVNQYRIGKSLVAIIILFTLISFSTPLFAQGEPQSGSAKSIQDSAQISQLRGVDQRVDYQSLTRYGPWDDRNYGVTREDLSLIPEKDQYLQNVPVFFKIFLRKEQPNLGEFYPRSALQYFQILHGGLKVNGKLYKEGLGIGYHPDPAEKTGSGNAAADATRAATNEVVLDLNVRGNEVSVECNPLNKLECVAGSNRSGGQTMYYSNDGGVSWNFSQTNSSSCCDPTVDWSSDGSKVYQADLSSTIGVRWAVSNDKGQTWGPMQVLTTSGSDKEFIHVDRSATSPHVDNIYLTYHNSNVMQFARSTDMGASFSTPIAFSSEPRGIGSDITTDAAGNIYYFYPALGGEGIRLLKSTDGGVTFGSSIQVAPLNGRFDFPIPSMETREVFIYVSADVDMSTGDIYVTWTDEANDSAGGGVGSAANNHAWIQVAKSTDQGVTWTVLPHPHDATDLISGTPIDRFHPWLKVADGIVHVAYYDTRHSVNRTGVDFYYTYSTNGGANWATERRFSTETSPNLGDGQEWGDYNGLSVVLDNMIMTWTDNRPGNDPASTDDKVAMAGKGAAGVPPPPGAGLPWMRLFLD
ncbi:MAG: glycoside hydrolase [Gammaproteobacteria bacterium]|nr:glycoside hydrolase [Gammaproteobacteria bacterium]